MILPVFKTGVRHLRDVFGAFDSHTLPPFVSNALPAVVRPSSMPILNCDSMDCDEIVMS